MNKIHIKWKAQVQLVLQTRGARCLADNTQPSYIRQPIGSAAWFRFSRIEEGSAFIPWVLVSLVAKLAHFAGFAFLGYLARFPIKFGKVSED